MLLLQDPNIYFDYHSLSRQYRHASREQGKGERIIDSFDTSEI
jgi:hypothetical protein